MKQSSLPTLPPFFSSTNYRKDSMKFMIRLLPLLFAIGISAAWADAVCGPHGTIGRDAKCVCEKAYAGAKCDVLLAVAATPLPLAPSCVNGGVLLRDGTCKCPLNKYGTPAFAGAYCEIPLAPPPPPPTMTP
jgi:hypothetical protein